MIKMSVRESKTSINVNPRLLLKELKRKNLPPSLEFLEYFVFDCVECRQIMLTNV